MQAVCAFALKGIDNNNKNANPIRSMPVVIMRDIYLGMRDRRRTGELP